MDELTTLDRQILKIAKRDMPTDKGLIIGAILAVREYDLEEDVQKYLEKYPDTSFMNLDAYITSLCPPIEIVD